MNKVVLVTGSSKGLGSEIVKQFSKNGYNTIINYNTHEKEAHELSKTIDNSFVIKMDITNETEVKKTIEDIIQKYGRLDVLINNAAIELDNLIEDKTKEEFMKVLEVNAVGPFLVSKYASKYANTIINISSKDASTTYNEYNIDYSASKAALNSITKSLSYIFKDKKILAIELPWLNTESVKSANDEYIKNELKRTKQKQLIEPSFVSKQIYGLLNRNIKSGTIIRWDEIDEY